MSGIYGFVPCFPKGDEWGITYGSKQAFLKLEHQESLLLIKQALENSLQILGAVSELDVHLTLSDHVLSHDERMTEWHLSLYFESNGLRWRIHDYFNGTVDLDLYDEASEQFKHYMEDVSSQLDQALNHARLVSKKYQSRMIYLHQQQLESDNRKLSQHEKALEAISENLPDPEAIKSWLAGYQAMCDFWQGVRHYHDDDSAQIVDVRIGLMKEVSETIQGPMEWFKDQAFTESKSSTDEPVKQGKGKRGKGAKKKPKPGQKKVVINYNALLDETLKDMDVSDKTLSELVRISFKLQNLQVHVDPSKKQQKLLNSFAIEKLMVLSDSRQFHWLTVLFDRKDFTILIKQQPAKLKAVLLDCFQENPNAARFLLQSIAELSTQKFKAGKANVSLAVFLLRQLVAQEIAPHDFAQYYRCLIQHNPQLLHEPVECNMARGYGSFVNASASLEESIVYHPGQSFTLPLFAWMSFLAVNEKSKWAFPIQSLLHDFIQEELEGDFERTIDLMLYMTKYFKSLLPREMLHDDVRNAYFAKLTPRQKQEFDFMSALVSAVGGWINITVYDLAVKKNLNESFSDRKELLCVKHAFADFLNQLCRTDEWRARIQYTHFRVIHDNWQSQALKVLSTASGSGLDVRPIVGELFKGYGAVANKYRRMLNEEKPQNLKKISFDYDLYDEYVIDLMSTEFVLRMLYLLLTQRKKSAPAVKKELDRIMTLCKQLTIIVDYPAKKQEIDEIFRIAQSEYRVPCSSLYELMMAVDCRLESILEGSCGLNEEALVIFYNWMQPIPFKSSPTVDDVVMRMKAEGAFEGVGDSGEGSSGDELSGDDSASFPDSADLSSVESEFGADDSALGLSADEASGDEVSAKECERKPLAELSSNQRLFGTKTFQGGSHTSGVLKLKL